MIHLNHGSFGATPRPVLGAQAEWRRRLESNPVRFMDEELAPAFAAATEAVARFIGAPAGAIGFVPNATSGVNAALRTLEPELRPGGEIVVTNHGYNACTNAARVTAERTGARVTVAEVPFPITGSQDVIDAVLAAVTPRTSVTLIDHVTSPTAIVFPVEDLVASLEPDIPVIVDGAHAPGMVPLDVEGLGASFYTGNCHKWMCAPKGAGFIAVREDRRSGALPPVISHAWNREWPPLSRYQALFAWTGTADPSAWLSVPTAIDAMAERFGGWDVVMTENRELARRGRDVLIAALSIDSAVPDGMLGAMAPVELPGDRIAEAGAGPGPDPLTRRLRHDHGIEAPVIRLSGGGRIIRISAQRYNRLHDYERLAAALCSVLD